MSSYENNNCTFSELSVTPIKENLRKLLEYTQCNARSHLVKSVDLDSEIFDRLQPTSTE